MLATCVTERRSMPVRLSVGSNPATGIRSTRHAVAPTLSGANHGQRRVQVAQKRRQRRTNAFGPSV